MGDLQKHFDGQEETTLERLERRFDGKIAEAKEEGRFIPYLDIVEDVSDHFGLDLSEGEIMRVVIQLQTLDMDPEDARRGAEFLMKDSEVAEQFTQYKRPLTAHMIRDKLFDVLHGRHTEQEMLRMVREYDLPREAWKRVSNREDGQNYEFHPEYLDGYAPD